MEHISYTETETEQIAAGLITALKPGKPLFLRGDLGAGKSVFARAMIRTLVGNPDLEVPSPTFTLVQTYDSVQGLVSHFDLYRLKTPEDVYELGWEETLFDGIVLVEWPERLGELAPRRYLDIHIESVENEPSQRIIKVTDHESDNS